MTAHNLSHHRTGGGTGIHSANRWRGVREVQDVRNLLNAGADKVSINTSAVVNPQLVADAAARYGSQCIVVAIDAKQVAPNKWEVFTHGGRKATGLDAVEWAKKMQSLGAGEFC